MLLFIRQSIASLPNLCVVRATWAKVGLPVGNMKFGLPVGNMKFGLPVGNIKFGLPVGNMKFNTQKAE